MEQITNFFNSYLDYLLLALIVLSGIYITKYTSEWKLNNTYKVLIASVLISITLYFITGCDKTCMTKYLFTYLFATSFYELFVKVIISKVNQILKTKNQ